MNEVMTQPCILVAGIGNIFLGDDAFGVEVVQRLARHDLGEEVRVVDFGICGLDLVYTLLDSYEVVILVDATARGGRPGTLYVMDLSASEAAEGSDSEPVVEPHNMDPMKVLRLAAAMGGPLKRLLLVGCEPTPFGEVEDMQVGMSNPVRTAVEEAVDLIEAMVPRLLRGEDIEAR